MYNPISTFRIQFHKDFTFADLEKLIPFFSRIGIGTIYASPIFKAVPGSNHGYDVTDPNVINPEIGTIDQLERVIDQLNRVGIGWIQDIVPNHMAFHTDNEMLMDLLDHGPDSKYAEFFDTSFATNFFQGPLMVPIQDGSFKESNGEYYRLCDWRETNTTINYRRFFTVNSLICLNMQSPTVFQHYHKTIFSLVQKKMFSGIRVDHIDGLLDPRVYLERLREAVGPDTYVVIEKILEPGEELDQTFPVQGTTGYDFLATLNNVFTWSRAERHFNQFYDSIIKNRKSFDNRVKEKKSMILFESMGGELTNLTNYFLTLDLGADNGKLRNTIASFLINCPWYRFYGNSFPLSKQEQSMVLDVLDDVRKDTTLDTDSFLLDEALIEKPANNDTDYNATALAFYQRLMQVAGPLMAKGVEDTLMYTFNRFIGHNEVGDSPEEFGTSIQSFHTTMIDRQNKWPMALNATATHDTKRGEDVRMRLNVLADIPEEWISFAKKWTSNSIIESDKNIDLSEKYFILQTIIGCYSKDDLIPRLEEYFTKAFREAKRHTGWTDPDELFESSVKEYISALLNSESFTTDFDPIYKKVNEFGIINSLSQLILKMTCPGIPDVYQGSVGWDLSLVDPDNRRPVDYQQLQNIINSDVDIETLWNARNDGRIKVVVTKLLLDLRRENPNLFVTGKYIPLEVKGRYKDNVLAFARVYQNEAVVVVVPLHLARIEGGEWGETSIVLPEGISKEWYNKIDTASGPHNGEIALSKLFATLPFAVLKFEKKFSERKAGILLPVTALPSSGPIGDFGPAARAFADFLFDSGQRIWQMLPVNITDSSVGFSPYSSYSAIAGNPLLISLDDLIDEKLLTEEEVYPKGRKSVATNNFLAAQKLKSDLLYRSWQRSSEVSYPGMFNDFKQFLEEESGWLNDFALFEWILRNEKKPWFEWPAPLRNRHTEAIETIVRDHSDELQCIKWIQFIFFRQAKALKEYCNNRGILLMGDIPIYVSHNSVDVWMNQDLFEIDTDGSMMGMAGVPPDYFNDEGQLWGMPVYRWDRMKEEGYAWWTFRIKKNIGIFDLLRLDHFRAFAKYWRVPKGETTATNGEWVDGPGAELFEVIESKLGKIEFIAEDLGEVDDTVFELRDNLRLPGMKVLQFAFEDDFPESIHLPHHHSNNFVVYTGTHDNNTTRGWIDEELSEAGWENLKSYLSLRSSKNVASALVELAYASVANTAIIPMQDLLNLPGSARMNKPSSTSNNWTWRLRSIPGEELVDLLKQLIRRYNR